MRLDNYIFVVTHYCLCAANVICRIHRNGGTSEWVTGRETEGNGWGGQREERVSVGFDGIKLLSKPFFDPLFFLPPRIGGDSW